MRRLATALPDVTGIPRRDGHLHWRVHDRLFAWERPLCPSDLAALGSAAPPPGPILGLRVADLGVREALIVDDPDACFTTPHFDGCSAVLVFLDRITLPALDELVVHAWLARAPKRLAAEYRAA